MSDNKDSGAPILASNVLRCCVVVRAVAVVMGNAYNHLECASTTIKYILPFIGTAKLTLSTMSNHILDFVVHAWPPCTSDFAQKLSFLHSSIFQEVQPIDALGLVGGTTIPPTHH